MINSNFNLYSTGWLDIVFSNRNKAYGAYELRQQSSNYTLRALAITLFIFAAGITLITVLHKKVPDVKVTVVTITPQPILPPVTKKEEIHAAKVQHHVVATKPSAHISKQALPIPEPTNDIIPDDHFTPQNKIIEPGLDNSKGDNTGLKTVIDGPPVTGTGEGKSVEQAGNTTAYDAGGVDVMPEPAGGMAAWARFLQKNIRYPDTEAEGKVYLSFIIEKDGKLSNIVLVRGVNPMLDDEALRVLKIAPAWKPGRQNGQPVRVKYSIPIVFQMSQ